MQETYQYPLRIPTELRDWIENESKMNGRSINSEIVARLYASFGDKEKGKPVSPVVAKEPQGPYDFLSGNERQMLALFRRWPAEKQLSFLVLFK